jgi:chromosome segregation ATPase
MIKVGTFEITPHGTGLRLYCTTRKEATCVLPDERVPLAAALLTGATMPAPADDAAREQTIRNYQDEVSGLRRERDQARRERDDAVGANATLRIEIADARRDRDREHVRANNAEARATTASRERDAAGTQARNAEFRERVTARERDAYMTDLANLRNAAAGDLTPEHLDALADRCRNPLPGVEASKSREHALARRHLQTAADWLKRAGAK